MVPVECDPDLKITTKTNMKRVLIGPISTGAAAVVMFSKAKWFWTRSISATSRFSAALSQEQNHHPHLLGTFPTRMMVRRKRKWPDW